MLALARLIPLLLSFHYVSASWRQEHAVTGLPTLDEPDLTSYAGLVTVRKDSANNIEVTSPTLMVDLIERSILLAF